jgi:cell shape-determining protein MreC
VSYAEELIMIQAISNSEKTVVVRKGAEDGVTPGQESLFSNKNISLMARATEVTRDFSLW